MGLFGKSRTYDRQRILEEAARARTKNKRGRAIELYRWVLAIERNNLDIHARLAPLLAETGQTFDAWNSYRLTAQAALREGRDDKALAIYREAARQLPREIQVWQSLARLLAKRGEESEAIEALVEGSRHFRSHWQRPMAIHLLRRSRTIQPWHFGSVLELARLLLGAGQRNEAHLLLEGLAERADGAEALRRVRSVEMRGDPGPIAVWRWIVAALKRSEAGEPAALVEPEEPTEHRAGVVPLRARGGGR